ncbi:MAG: SDR family NAD(P)-dependent oxidoreductase, partial [Planctomycetes bacterium]|nr:SDR family NAD(P)-dependent oxidoreductase [Planctomycetota bacterium]
MELKDKVALVTGGSRGIGRAIAVSLAREGAGVVINYLRQKAAAAETLREIQSAGGRGLIVKANVAEEQGIETIFARIREEFGALDMLVSNAAMGVLRSIPELTVRHFAWTMEINALSLIPLAQRAIPMMLSRGGGRIVAVSSLGATRAIPNYTAVGASKAALESIVRHLAIEMAGKNINVN